MFYDILFGHLTTVDGGITAHCITIMNHADCDLIMFMEFMVNRCDSCKGEMYTTARKLGHELFPTAPHTKITEKGEIVYSECNCENVCKLQVEAYVEEMASGEC
jgi:fatty acid synthase subunit alpha